MWPRGPFIGRKECHEGYYRKKWTDHSRFWVENTFGVMIFWIFHFQKTPPIILSYLVKKIFSYLKVEYVISVEWPSPYMTTTETQLYISGFYEWKLVRSSNRYWIVFKYQIPHPPPPYNKWDTPTPSCIINKSWIITTITPYVKFLDPKFDNVPIRIES